MLLRTLGLLVIVGSGVSAHTPIVTHAFIVPTLIQKDAETELLPEYSGVVKIKPGRNGRFYYTIYDKNNVLLAMSSPTGFSTEDDVVATIEQLKQMLEQIKIAPFKGAGVFLLKQGRDDRFYFVAYDENKRAIALCKPKGWPTREECIDKLKQLKHALAKANIETLQ